MITFRSIMVMSRWSKCNAVLNVYFGKKYERMPVWFIQFGIIYGECMSDCDLKMHLNNSYIFAWIIHIFKNLCMKPGSHIKMT